MGTCYFCQEFRTVDLLGIPPDEERGESTGMIFTCVNCRRKYLLQDSYPFMMLRDIAEWFGLSVERGTL